MDTHTEPVAETARRLPFDMQVVLDGLGISPEQEREFLFVLLVGSFAEGLDSPTSDVDLVFVGPNAATFAPSGEFKRVVIHGRRVEAWNLSLATFELHAAVADEHVFRGLPMRQLELTHKLVTAVCLAGKATYENAIAPRRAAFPARMCDYFSQSAEGVFKDVVGALQVHDHVTAAGQARELVGFAVDAWLASKGDTYPKRKWRARRLLRRRERIPALAAEYVAIEFGGLGSLDESAVKKWIDKCLALVRGFQLDQYFGTASAVMPADAPREMFYLYRADDRFIVRSSSTVLQVGAPAALALLSGNSGDTTPESRAQLLRFGLISSGAVA